MKNKNWIGNKNSVFTTLAASSHAKGVREVNDYYATDPIAMNILLEVENFSNNIWECACGEGHLSTVLVENGYNVKSTDLIDRGYGEGCVDFLNYNGTFEGDIITNPPYKYASKFLEKAISIIPNGNKIAMFLKLQFLEGQARKKNI